MNIDEEQAFMWTVVKSVECPTCLAKIGNLCDEINPGLHQQRVNLYRNTVEISRIDKYSIKIGFFEVPATPAQEARLREMTPEQVRDFRKIMTGY